MREAGVMPDDVVLQYEILGMQGSAGLDWSAVALDPRSDDWAASAAVVRLAYRRTKGTLVCCACPIRAWGG